MAALSAEEERLWSIVRANSLEFDAWTALIEETEKVAEVNALLASKGSCYVLLDSMLVYLVVKT